ncbi:hypothetical protein [Pelagicoccus mobilis]|uniref:Xylose isomerase n=1 Tax=Pelagicoccus mobilis TaxID=415221 RepID=A0A934RVU4_9BACT|nr:hypothetical protein [Pelagicoccus mobilis]MBK1877421.1 hypothetical protein [Pelagicoccus mobilis]
MHQYLNDQSNEPPKLRIYLNLENLIDLPAHSIGHELKWPEAEGRLHADGFQGVQLTGESQPIEGGQLPYCGLDRINKPEESDAIFACHKERGDQCITLHVGWGMESDAEAHNLIDSILNASEKHHLPAFIETHRATITQDAWRTVEWTKSYPEIRFNGDYSHFYCGQEMVYGDLEERFKFMQPIFDRVGFLHGRIAAPGYMQAPIENTEDRPKQALGTSNYLEHFKEMWRRSMTGFRANAPAGSVLVFAPELLASHIFYARVFPDPNGNLQEETDRYQQALLYRQLAQECWAEA